MAVLGEQKSVPITGGGAAGIPYFIPLIADTEVSGTNPLPVSGTLTQGTSTTGTKANVSASASSVTIRAALAGRKGLSVYNDSSAILYLDTTGGTASATSFTIAMAANSYYELPAPVVVGAVTGIWASATGAARVVEYT